MKKILFVLFAIMLMSTVVGLFHIQNQVKNLKKDLVEVHRQIAEDKAVIHVLNAEWAYLNEPARIQKLADRYLQLEYSNVAQLKDTGAIKSVYLARVQPRKGDVSHPQLEAILSSYRR